MIVQSGLKKGMEATWVDTGLFARAAIYDITSGSPVFVNNAVMSEVTPGSYLATMIPVAGTSYFVVKRVYTNNSFTTVDSNYSPSTESFQSIDFTQPSSNVAITGEILAIIEDNTITAIVED